MRATFFLLLLVPVLTRGQVGFRVDQPKLYFNEQNGAVTPTRVVVKNPSPVRMVIRASCADWRRDSLGNKQFFPAGTLPASCCPYLQVEPETIELPPGGQQEIRVALKPTPGLNQQRVQNGMLLLTQINEQEIAAAQEKKSQMVYKVQLGIHLYYTSAGAKEKSIVIDTLTLGSFKETPRLSVRVNNTGDLQLESHLRFELTNLQTAEETKLPVLPVNTLPGDRIWVTPPLPGKLMKGRYLVVVILDSGVDTPLQVAELEAEL